MPRRVLERRVMLPVLIQDPAVAGETTESTNIIQAVAIEDKLGFTEGPACRRVAVVDLDFRTGKLGTPVRLDSKKNAYRRATYRTAVPTRKGARVDPRTGYRTKFDLDDAGALDRHHAFLKVSVFGTVVQTLAMIQTALGRQVRWAFPGRQLLVVPRAGELDNAFYHRDSRSLQFYYGSNASGRTVYSALSQDIVAHEATHAVVDGIAPDLYDAISPESLAIHEALADMTAALVSMRNRERLVKTSEPKVVREIQKSSRFSRIAEEFGRWRGHGDALRDVCNTKTLNTRARKHRVDRSSPHSLSEVLSGLLFRVFRDVFANALSNPIVAQRFHKWDGITEGMRHRIRYTSNRWLSLVYRGLDWLPPGDAGFAELVQAMVAADRLFLPNDEFARRVLVEEAARRHIVVRECEAASTRLDGMSMDRGSILEAFREELQVPGDARVKVTIRPFHVYEPEIVVRSTDDVYKLTPKVLPEWIVPENEHFLVKFAWWYTERNDLSPAWGAGRRVRTGATIVIDRNGTVRALIRNQPALQASSRSALLKRLCAGDLERPARRVGPDGAPLHDGPRATVRGDTLRIAGAMQALHVSGDDLWMP